MDDEREGCHTWLLLGRLVLAACNALDYDHLVLFIAILLIGIVPVLSPSLARLAR